MNKDFERLQIAVLNLNDNNTRKALLSYKKILGLKEDEEFKNYCSACCPVWFMGNRYGIGPNPTPYPGSGEWHGKFQRRKFPIGSIKTNDDGNMVYTKTGKLVNHADGELIIQTI